MALTAAYFVNELLVPGVVGGSYAQVENLTMLESFIAKYEPEFLKRILGEQLYAEYAAAIALSPTSGAWFDLNAQLYQTTPFYQSPAANYVYFKFWKHNATVTAAQGETQAKFENSELVSIGAKMVRAWNEMCDLSDAVQQWIDDHATDYTTWGTEDHESMTKISIYGC